VTQTTRTKNVRLTRHPLVSRLPSLVGRGPELARLAQLLEAVRAGESAALVVRGEAGIGKSALLEHAAEHADGARVVRAAGVESEMELAFAALHQLCLPLLEGLEGLPSPQRDALGTAFGLSFGEPPARFLVGLAVLSLLSDAAEAQPLVCLVDDTQWLDRSSAQVLSFVARRLQAESVLVLFAERDQDGPDDLAGLPELRLHGLTDSDARELLAATNAGPLDQPVRDRIIAETRGNPLALLELPRAFSSGDLAGGFAVPGGLRSQLEARFRRQVAELPAETQRLLLVAAAEPMGDATLLARAAAELDIPITTSAPAEAAGLVELGARVTFRHPLLRSAIYGAAAPDARRAAHGALAAASDSDLDLDRRAWHRAQATPVPDEQVAAELEQSAARARARGGLAAAAAFLERSAALTPDATRRVERALDAAEFKHKAGSLDAAERLVLEAESGPLDELKRARAERLRGRIAFASSRREDAPLLILSAARRLQGLDAPLARETYVEALAAAIYLGQREALLEVARALPAGWPSESPRAAELLMTGWAQLIIEGYPAGTDLMRRGLSAFMTEHLSGEEEIRGLWFASRVAQATWDDESAQLLSARHVQLARDEGALAALPPALEMLAVSRADAGEFAAAAALVNEADGIAAATGSPPLGHLMLLVAAWCDPEESALGRIDAFIRDAHDKGWETSINYAEYAAAVLHNGCGSYQAALEAAERSREHHPAGGFGSVLSELVEAAIRTDQPELAAAVCKELSQRTHVGSDSARGLQARADALVSAGDTAETYYRESVERLGRTSRRPDLARSHLVYGEWLRRENRRVDARAQLRSAHELFSAMGAEAFTERSRRELLATGERARRRVDETRGELTPQETQIARLAADGYTNPEIGAQLFLSPRTVEWHLRKVYSKLGISSRRQLRTVVGSV
jgi:DNA-binding CsgD family transcriptional regulator